MQREQRRKSVFLQPHIFANPVFKTGFLCCVLVALSFIMKNEFPLCHLVSYHFNIILYSINTFIYECISPIFVIHILFFLLIPSVCFTYISIS